VSKSLRIRRSRASYGAAHSSSLTSLNSVDVSVFRRFRRLAAQGLENIPRIACAGRSTESVCHFHPPNRTGWDRRVPSRPRPNWYATQADWSPGIPGRRGMVQGGSNDRRCLRGLHRLADEGSPWDQSLFDLVNAIAAIAFLLLVAAGEPRWSPGATAVTVWISRTGAFLRRSQPLWRR